MIYFSLVAFSLVDLIFAIVFNPRGKIYFLMAKVTIQLTTDFAINLDEVEIIEKPLTNVLFLFSFLTQN